MNVKHFPKSSHNLSRNENEEEEKKQPKKQILNEKSDKDKGLVVTSNVC